MTSGDWSALATNALLLGVLPVSDQLWIYYLVHRYLPTPSSFIFSPGFFNAMLAAGVVVLTLVFLLVTTEVYSFARISSDYLPFVPLYLFGGHAQRHGDHCADRAAARLVENRMTTKPSHALDVGTGISLQPVPSQPRASEEARSSRCLANYSVETFGFMMAGRWRAAGRGGRP